jgi:hypothetical protein
MPNPTPNFNEFISTKATKFKGVRIETDMQLTNTFGLNIGNSYGLVIRNLFGGKLGLSVGGAMDFFLGSKFSHSKIRYKYNLGEVKFALNSLTTIAKKKTIAEEWTKVIKDNIEVTDNKLEATDKSIKIVKQKLEVIDDKTEVIKVKVSNVGMITEDIKNRLSSAELLIEEGALSMRKISTSIAESESTIISSDLILQESDVFMIG